jgi:hypothetical protein
MREPWYRSAKCLLLVMMSFAAMSVANASGSSTVQRDLEGYAIASCLVDMNQPYLKDQGDGWGAVIVQRSKLGLEALNAIAAVVKTEVAKGDMAVVRVETDPEKDLALPVMYCNEIIYASPVRAAINKAVKKFAPAH